MSESVAQNPLLATQDTPTLRSQLSSVPDPYAKKLKATIAHPSLQNQDGSPTLGAYLTSVESYTSKKHKGAARELGHICVRVLNVVPNLIAMLIELIKRIAHAIGLKTSIQEVKDEDGKTKELDVSTDGPTGAAAEMADSVGQIASSLKESPEAQIDELSKSLPLLFKDLEQIESDWSLANPDLSFQEAIKLQIGDKDLELYKASKAQFDRDAYALAVLWGRHPELRDRFSEEVISIVKETRILLKMDESIPENEEISSSIAENEKTVPKRDSVVQQSANSIKIDAEDEHSEPESSQNGIKADGDLSQKGNVVTMAKRFAMPSAYEAKHAAGLKKALELKRQSGIAEFDRDEQAGQTEGRAVIAERQTN